MQTLMSPMHSCSLGLDSRIFYPICGHQGATINMRETPERLGDLGCLNLQSTLPKALINLARFNRQFLKDNFTIFLDPLFLCISLMG